MSRPGAFNLTERERDEEIMQVQIIYSGVYTSNTAEQQSTTALIDASAGCFWLCFRVLFFISLSCVVPFSPVSVSKYHTDSSYPWVKQRGFQRMLR